MGRKNNRNLATNICAVCGKEGYVEIHHKTPIILGGTDDHDNLICLCPDCHDEAHKNNRSILTKIGMKKAENEPREALWSRDEVYAKFFDALAEKAECDEPIKLDGDEIIALLDSIKRVKAQRGLSGREKRKNEFFRSEKRLLDAIN